MNKKQILIAGLFSVLTIFISCHADRQPPLPQYFGLYLETTGNLQEIPLSGDPLVRRTSHAFKSALQNRSPDAFGDSLKKLLSSCRQSSAHPIFILFHNQVTPENLEFAKLWGTSKEFFNAPPESVELGISPVEGRTGMFKLSPKAPLPTGAYALFGKSEFARDQITCLLVNTTVDQLFSAQKK